jgi:hypothetical protein
MTHAEWTRELTALRCKVTKARNLRLKCKGLADKLAAERALRVAQDNEFAHKLNYFDLLTGV